MTKSILIVLIGLCFWGNLRAQSDMDLVKTRVVDGILHTSIDDSTVPVLLQSIRTDGSWPGINYEDLSNTGFENRVHLANMEYLAMAYRREPSSFYKDQGIRDAVNLSLKFWCEHDFICENWWHNQVNTPTKLANVLLLMDGEITPGLRTLALDIISRGHLNAPGARPGGDRIKFGGIDAKRRLVVGDEEAFAEIMQTVNDEIHFNTGGRGMQCDYSFHHRYDRVNTTYSYGGGYAKVFAEWAAYVAGTRYAFHKEQIEQLIDYFLDGICRQAVYGIYLEKGAMNRGIARKETFRPMSTDIPENLLTTSDYRRDELEEIVALRRGELQPETSFARFYWQSEHFVCQRPEFFASVRMYSVRNQNMEYPHNSEGILNHHKGDGANFLSIRGDEYLNIWPVYDWQKIPGATILQKPQMPPANEVQKPGLTNFVGAVTDGVHGAVAFDFISPHDLTRARKGWFFFQEAYVCLGAGIESPSRTLPVVTTVNQALLKGEVMVSDARGVHQPGQGEHLLEDVKWVSHNGTGYFFPESTTLYLSNKEAQGRWTDISKQSSSPKELVSKDVFSLWIDHGIRPQGNIGGFNYGSTIPRDVGYQYTIVPVLGPEGMEIDPGLEVLSNSRMIQAVKHRDSGMVQAIFYQGGTLEIASGIQLSLDAPGAVMLKITGGRVTEITASDPSRTQSRMHMHISGMDEVLIDLPGGENAGKSVKVSRTDP